MEKDTENKIKDGLKQAAKDAGLAKGQDVSQEKEIRDRLMAAKLPQKRSMYNMLIAMKKPELEDVCYNLDICGISRLTKAEIAKKIVPKAIDFFRRMLPSVVTEQYQALKYIYDHDGITSDINQRDFRLDTLHMTGILGTCTLDGKLAWYMPDEVMKEWKRIDSDALRRAADLNDEMARLATGLVFYCGWMNFDNLYKKVSSYLEKDDEISFMDFVGVMYNAASWRREICARPDGLYYYTVLDPVTLAEKQADSGLEYADISYSDAYDAGESGYIESTNAYKKLAQYLMTELNLDVLKAANIVGEINILMQNEGSLRSATEFLEKIGAFGSMEKVKALMPLLMEYHNTSRLWYLRGHKPIRLHDRKYYRRALKH